MTVRRHATKLLAVSVFAMSAAEAATPTIGYTVTHTNVNCGEADSRKGTKRRAGIVPTHNIILNYDRPAVRSHTRSVLNTMRRQGAQMLRSVIWFKDAKTDPGATQADVLGMIPVRRGALDQGGSRKLAAFAEDVRAAGYETLVLVAGPQGRANPKCRQRNWGDCFAPESMLASWAAIKAVKLAVRAAEAAGLRVVFDIAPEMCAVPAQPAYEPRVRYVRFMAERWTASFGQGNFIISCGGGTDAEGALRAMTATAGLLNSMAARPAALDIHMYYNDRANFAAALRGANHISNRNRLPLWVLESYHGDAMFLDALRQQVSSGALDRLAMVAPWPLSRGSGCHFSVKAPYSLSRLKAAVRPGS